MTDKVKKLAPKILEAINSSQNILLHCHPGMDGDSVGSTLAMMLYLKSLGKNVLAIAGDDREVPGYLKVLPEVENIQNKTFNEVDLSKFDLFIIQDTSSKKRITNFGEVNFPEHLTTIVIDHHPDEGLGDISLTEDFRIAACEILVDLFNEWQVKITPKMAVCLLLGIYTDSGGFKFRKTSPHTFEVAAQLSEIYPQYTDTIFQMNNGNDPQSLLFQGLILSNIENYFNGSVALGVVSNLQLKEKNISEKYTHGGLVSNLLISVKGWNIGITVIEKEPKRIYLSMRTRDEIKFNLSKIAQVLGGGGHPAASAAILEMPLEAAKAKLLETIHLTFPELGNP